MKIEVGKAYKARNGARVVILEDDGDEEFPFNADNEESYTVDGRVFRSQDTELDLIAPWEEPTVGRSLRQQTIHEYVLAMIRNGGIYTEHDVLEIVKHATLMADEVLKGEG